MEDLLKSYIDTIGINKINENYFDYRFISYTLNGCTAEVYINYCDNPDMISGGCGMLCHSYILINNNF